MRTTRASLGPWGLLVVVLLTSCSALEQRRAMLNARYRLEAVRLEALDFGGADFAVRLSVENPNEIQAVLDALDFEFFVNDRHVAEGRSETRLTVPPGAAKVLPLDVRVPYSDIANIASLLRSEKPKTYAVRGTAHFETPLGTFGFPVDVSGEFR